VSLFDTDSESFSAKDVTSEMSSSVSIGVYSLKTITFFTMSGVKMMNCVIEDRLVFVMGILSRIQHNGKPYICDSKLKTLVMPGLLLKADSR
jgi:hypothetical protein